MHSRVLICSAPTIAAAATPLSFDVSPFHQGSTNDVQHKIKEKTRSRSRKNTRSRERSNLSKKNLLMVIESAATRSFPPAYQFGSDSFSTSSINLSPRSSRCGISKLFSVADLAAAVFPARSQARWPSSSSGYWPVNGWVCTTLGFIRDNSRANQVRAVILKYPVLQPWPKKRRVQRQVGCARNNNATSKMRIDGHEGSQTDHDAIGTDSTEKPKERNTV
jgi:hypothetical protein